MVLVLRLVDGFSFSSFPALGFVSSSFGAWSPENCTMSAIDFHHCIPPLYVTLYSCLLSMKFNVKNNGRTPEYIYGNYFERLPGKLLSHGVDMVKKEDKEEEVENFGLRELIDGGDVARGRVLHRNINISS